MTSSLDADLLQSFVAEASDLLDEIDPALVAYPKTEDVGDRTDILNRVFRHFHSLKGSTGFLGFAPMARLTHEVENYLDLFRRTPQARMSEGQVNLICRAVDCLRGMLAAIASTGTCSESAETEAAIEEIGRNAALIRQQGFPAAQVVTAGNPVPAVNAAPSTPSASAVLPSAPVAAAPAKDKSGVFSRRRSLPPTEFANRYVSEAHELLDQVEQALLNAEQRTDDNGEVVAEALRLLHSFKGNSGFMGLSDLERLGHRMESSISLARQCEASAANTVFDTMLQMLDILRQGVVEFAKTGQAKVAELDTYLQLLDGLDNEVRGKILPAKPSTDIVPPPAVGGVPVPAAVVGREPKAPARADTDLFVAPSPVSSVVVLNPVPPRPATAPVGPAGASSHSPTEQIVSSPPIPTMTGRPATTVSPSNPSSPAQEFDGGPARTVKALTSTGQFTLLRPDRIDLNRPPDPLPSSLIHIAAVAPSTVSATVTEAVASSKSAPGVAGGLTGAQTAALPPMSAPLPSAGPTRRASASPTAVAPLSNAAAQRLAEVAPTAPTTTPTTPTTPTPTTKTAPAIPALAVSAGGEGRPPSARSASTSPAFAREGGAAAGIPAPAAPRTAEAFGGATRNTADTTAGMIRNDIRVDLAKLDAMLDLVGELVIAEAMVTTHPVLAGAENESLERAIYQLRRAATGLQDMAMSVRMIPLATTFRRMIRLVFDLSNKAGKRVDLELVGEETEVDKTVIEHIADPLVHIIRNAIDHGIESAEERKIRGKPPAGKIVIEGRHEGGEVWVMVSDDGGGLSREKLLRKGIERGLVVGDGSDWSDQQVYQLIFEPGLSTAAKVTDISGRGVGMDVVKKNLEKLNGKIDIRTRPGEGTVMVIRIPLTLAIIDGMLVRSGGQRYIIPLLMIRESLRPTGDQIMHTPDGQELVRIRDDLVPVVRLHEVFRKRADIENLEEGILVVVEPGDGETIALFADELMGQQETVIKGLTGWMKKARGVSGCTIFGDGEVGLILDVGEIAGRLRAATASRAEIRVG